MPGLLFSCSAIAPGEILWEESALHQGRRAEVARYTLGDPLAQLDEGELGRAVDGGQKVEPPLLGPDLDDVDVKSTDG